MENKNRKKDPPKILIVDDISINVEIMENIIREEGYEPLCALSVKEAVDIMKETLPTLILSDLSMPEIDGLEFCKMVKGNPRTRDIPFMFISVMDTSEEKERAFLAGAVDFIPKPFDRIEVVMRVNNQLNAYQLKREMADYNRMMHKMVEEQKKQIVREQENVLKALTKILERRYADKGRHLKNVGYNCRLLAQSLQFLPKYESQIRDEFIETIETASQLYDIGDFAINNAGLFRETHNEEWTIRHIDEGVSILEDIGQGQKSSRFLFMAMQVVKYHHTHWDGTGYPEIDGDNIPLEARIVTLVNEFDRAVCNEALEMSVEEHVRAVVEKGGTIYDPDLVEVFGKIWRQMKIE